MSYNRGGKKSKFVRVGNMLKSDAEHTPTGAVFSYSTQCSGEYLDYVVMTINTAHKAGLPVRFSLIKWEGQDAPVLSVSGVTKPANKIQLAPQSDPGL